MPQRSFYVSGDGKANMGTETSTSSPKKFKSSPVKIGDVYIEESKDLKEGEVIPKGSSEPVDPR